MRILERREEFPPQSRIPVAQEAVRVVVRNGLLQRRRGPERRFRHWGQSAGREAQEGCGAGVFLGDGGAAVGDVLVLPGVVAGGDGAPFGDFEPVVLEVVGVAGCGGAEAGCVARGGEGGGGARGACGVVGGGGGCV